MKKLQRVGSVIVVCIMIVAGLYQLSALTERKASNFKYVPFYQQQEDFDVLFMGTSHVINGIFPMELWNKYGIVSYNFGGHGNTLVASYWQMVNAFDYTRPRLVVIDCLKLSSQQKITTDDKSVTHLSLDAIPISINKIKAVCDLLDTNQDKKEFLFNFCVYHDRWKELGKNDFNPYVTTEKGAESRIGVAVPDEFLTINRDEKLIEHTVGEEYLRKMIQYCQDRQVDILLMYLPFPANEIQQKEANTVFDIAQEYGVEYLDFSTLKELVDFDIDCYDANSHLNPSGARKITSYIGQYIMEHYDIKDQRENEDYNKWHEDYKVYTRQKINNIKGQTSLKSALMLLNDENLSFSIYIPKDSDLRENEILEKLLRNAGIDTDKISEKEDVLVTVDRCSDFVYYSNILETQKTTFGEIAVLDGTDGYGFYLNRDNKLKLKASTEVALLVFDNIGMQIVAANRFKQSEVDFVVVRD